MITEKMIERLAALSKVGFGYDLKPEDRDALSAAVAALSAPQADYERRIRSALTTEPAAPEGRQEPVACECTKIEQLERENAELKRAIDEARKVIEPFALVAEHDIGEDETDSDAFRPMPKPFNHAPQITVGHLRAARRALEAQGDDDA